MLGRGERERGKERGISPSLLLQVFLIHTEFELHHKTMYVMSYPPLPWREEVGCCKLHMV